MLKRASDEDEVREIINTASVLNTPDLISWKNRRSGVVTPRTRLEDDLAKEVSILLSSEGVEFSDEEARRFVARLLKIINERRYPSN